VRIGDLVMRYGFSSQLATLECTSSRRSTVMCALPRATALTTEYQRDSSSKRPQSSVVSAARAPTRASPTGCQTADAASRASRPAGGAVGAPGPRARCPTNVPYVGKLSLAGRVPGCNVTVADLTQGHSLSTSGRTIAKQLHATVTSIASTEYKGRPGGGGPWFVHGLMNAASWSTRWLRLMRKTRIINRRESTYYEHVHDPSTGDVLHHCEEPLTSHQHGDAKRQKGK
jgi:hypothetical protein